jgi:ribosome biogenesis GTPase
MKSLQNGGYLIDSPGVRDYAPALADPTEAQLGFREIAKASQFCRFSNCKHLREPGCAIKQAIKDNKIDYRRYESYKRVVNLTSKLIEKKY